MTLCFSDTICKPSWFILPWYGCYYIYQKRTTWLNAGLNCIQSNGSLVSWETRDEFFTMKTYLQNNFCELQGTIFFFYSITVGIHSAETPSMVDPQVRLAVSGRQPLFTLGLFMFVLSLVDSLSLPWGPSTDIENFFYFCPKYHLKDTHKIFTKIMLVKIWMVFFGQISIKLGTSSIWGFL